MRGIVQNDDRLRARNRRFLSCFYTRERKVFQVVGTFVIRSVFYSADDRLQRKHSVSTGAKYLHLPARRGRRSFMRARGSGRDRVCISILVLPLMASSAVSRLNMGNPVRSSFFRALFDISGAIHFRGGGSARPINSRRLRRLTLH